jgi:hypothetical protein
MQSSSNSATKVNIWLSQPFFITGETLSGAVYLDNTQSDIKADKLVLHFIGTTEVISWTKNVKNQHRFLKRDRKITDIARDEFTLAKFDSKYAPEGKTAYAFKINTFEEMPPSLLQKSSRIQGL